MSTKALNFSEFDRYQPIIDQLKKNISIDDIDSVVTALNGKRIGNLKNIWDKVLLIKNHVLDENVKFEDKIIPIASLCYAVLPIDVVPDIVPILGFGDDASVILAIVSKLSLNTLSVHNITDSKVENSEKQKSLTIDFSVCQKVLNAKYIVSLMGHAANADDLLEQSEKQKIFEVIDYLLFSEEGGLHEKNLEKQRIKKSFLRTELHSYFESPIPFKDVLDYIALNVPENEYSVWYLYAYCIVNVEGFIKNSERHFLDLLAIKLNINQEEQLKIEAVYNKDWFTLAV